MDHRTCFGRSRIGQIVSVAVSKSSRWRLVLVSSVLGADYDRAPCRNETMTTSTRPPVHAKRIGPTLVPNRSRVLMRPFYPSSDDIARRVVARVMALPDEEIARLLGRVLGEFADRHEHVEQFFRNRFTQVCH